MRIVGGRLKGRALKGPASSAIRPTSDRLRETIFNILAHAYDEPVTGARVIDLFAGTGALAIEAISRGAAAALLIDQGVEAGEIIQANIEALGLADTVRLIRRDARKLGAAPAGERYGLAFLDPPYGKSLAHAALAALYDGGWLEPGALLVIEESAEADVALPDAFAVLEARRFGETKIIFARLARDPAPPSS